MAPISRQEITGQISFEEVRAQPDKLGSVSGVQETPAEPLDQEQAPIPAYTAARLSLRAMTADGATGHAAAVEKLGPPQALDNGTRYTR